MWVKIAIASLLVVILILISLVLRTPSVGQAIQIDVPLEGPIDLDMEQEFLLNIEEIGSVDFLITLSGETEPLFVELSTWFTTDQKDQVKYVLNQAETPGQFTGLLSSVFSESGDIFLNEDTVPDLRASLVEGYLHVLNLNYITPAVANITLLTEGSEVVDSNILYVVKDEPVVYLFDVASTKTPVVTAVWQDGAELSEEEFSIIEEDETSVLAQLSWTPTEENAARVLVVTATVDDEIAVKKFIFSTDNVVYALLDEQFPEVVMKAVDEGVFSVQYTFKPTVQLQPFSLPCGFASIEELPAESVAAILSYDESSVQQWKKDLPSDLVALGKNKGYLLQLKEEEEVSFTIGCTLPFVPDFTSLPELDDTWNLVGISGFESVLVEDLITPVGKDVTKVYEITIGGAVTSQSVTELEPMKAYWVKVE